MSAEVSESRANVGNSSARNLVAVVWRNWRLRACGVCIRRFPCCGKATSLAGFTPEPDRVWQFALLGTLCVRRESPPHQSGATGRRRMDRSRTALQGLPGHDGPADFDGAARLKLPLIEEAAANFLDNAPDDKRVRFQKFCKSNISWLPDYAMFNVLRQRYDYVSWNEWPTEYAHRKHDAMTAVMNQCGRELAVEQAIQFFFNEQWCALKSYCAERKIRILGDVAIFVSYDSADVWMHPEIFELDEHRRPIRVSGVPPDYFSKTGQRWGNPLYKWGELRERGFDWWVARIRRALSLYDIDSARSLPWLRGILVHRSRRGDRNQRHVGEGSRTRTLPSTERGLRKPALYRGRPGSDYTGGRRTTRALRNAGDANPAVRLL